MISCPVCGTVNHHLSVNCTSCGGFIQSRVDNLDLFATLWRVIENPKAAFFRISMARYKNYSSILAAITGVGLIFMYFWYLNAADHTGSMLNLVVGGLVAGPVFGVLLVLLGAVGMRLAFGIFRVRATTRNLYAVLAYASVPVVMSVVFLLPLEIFSLGRYFFSGNPPPWLIKPVSYYLFLSLDGIVGAWTVVLALIGLKTLTGSRWSLTALIVGVALLILVGLALAGEYFLTATRVPGVAG